MTTSQTAATIAANAAIEVLHVSKTYVRAGASVRALQDVSLCVLPGEFCALMGPSGCGKSTLLNLMAGLDSPTSGEIKLNGRATASFSDGEWTEARRHSIGMVFQAFHLLPGLTAEDNVALPLLLAGRERQVVEERVRWGLEAVGMLSRCAHRPGELSGGEQQRVAIARALMLQPSVLLADEPTGNLDSATGAEILDVLRALPRRFRQAVFLVTHSREAARLADRVVLMQDGRLVP